MTDSKGNQISKSPLDFQISIQVNKFTVFNLLIQIDNLSIDTD